MHNTKILSIKLIALLFWQQIRVSTLLDATLHPLDSLPTLCRCQLESKHNLDKISSAMGSWFLDPWLLMASQHVWMWPHFSPLATLQTSRVVVCRRGWTWWCAEPLVGNSTWKGRPGTWMSAHVAPVDRGVSYATLKFVPRLCARHQPRIRTPVVMCV